MLAFFAVVLVVFDVVLFDLSADVVFTGVFFVVVVVVFLAAVLLFVVFVTFEVDGVLVVFFAVAGETLPEFGVFTNAIGFCRAFVF